MVADNEKILKVIYRAVDSVNKELGLEVKIVKDPQTRLLQEESGLDSLGVVTLIMAIERELKRTLKVSMTLVNEEMLSKKRTSPFFSIQTLADYILKQLKKNAHD